MQIRSQQNLEKKLFILVLFFKVKFASGTEQQVKKLQQNKTLP
jgi:hypothetical protein